MFSIKALPFVWASLLSPSSASLLRGSWGNKEHQSREARADSGGFVECLFLDIDGLEEPGRQLTIDIEYTCEVKPSATNEARTLFFDGDVRARFGPKVSSGFTKMIIPRDAIDGTLIKSDHPAISFIDDDDSRRKRHLAFEPRKEKVLLVRVLGNNGAAPRHSRNQLYDDFFNDENNLAKRLAACSGNKLILEPATGTDVNNGVININVNMMMRDKPYMDVGDKVSSSLYGRDLDYKRRIYIIPDEVEFYGAAAYATINGDTIWMKDYYANAVMAQVHEYGHLLGLHHSGKGKTADIYGYIKGEPGDQYRDTNGYMGNALSWGDDGTITCFNGPKLWHLKWFEYRHLTIDPSENAFDGHLVSHDDVVNKIAGDLKMIVKVAGTNTKKIYVIYNRAKGINGGSMGDANQVVITEQSRPDAVSWHQAALSQSNPRWTLKNFDGGRSLVIKFCDFFTKSNGRSEARVLIYLQGLNDLTCNGNPAPVPPSPRPPVPTPPTSGNNCQDSPGWYDSGGRTFTCSWYAEFQKRCTNFGAKFKNMGKVANEACCACGGGTKNNKSYSPPVSSPVRQPSPTHQEPKPTPPAPTPTASGGSCQDIPGWHDSFGDTFNCDWYAQSASRCTYLGHDGRNMNKVANEACCTCGGGIYSR